MTEFTVKYLKFLFTVILCIKFSYALSENCTQPCSLTEWYSWNCTSCYHGGNRAFRQRGICCVGITDLVICLKVLCKTDQSRVLEEGSCQDHCGVRTTTLPTTMPTTLPTDLTTTAFTSTSSVLMSTFTTSKSLTSTRRSTSTATSTRANLRIFTSSVRAETSTSISNKALITLVAAAPYNSRLSSRPTSPIMDTPLIPVNSVGPASPYTSYSPFFLCGSSTCISTTTELSSTVGSAVPTRISGHTDASTNGVNTGNTGYGTKAKGSSVCLALCRRSEDWTKCMQDCLYDNDRKKMCTLLWVCLFMIGLIVGVFLMLILLYCIKRKKEKKPEHSECERSKVNGCKVADSTPTDKLYKNEPMRSNNGSTEFRNGYHIQKGFTTSTINSAKMNDKINSTSEANREKQYARRIGTIQDHVTHSKLENGVLRSKENGHCNNTSSLSSLNRTRRSFDKESDSPNNGVQSDINKTQHKNGGTSSGAFGSAGSKRLVLREGDDATPVPPGWQRNKMCILRPVIDTKTDAEGSVRVMSVNPNSALRIPETLPFKTRP